MKQEDEMDVEDLSESNASEILAIIARIDERTKNTNEMLEQVIEQRIEPLEKQVENADNRSRRNQVILSAFVTGTSIVFAWMLGFVPI
jgi:hypothetical protein